MSIELMQQVWKKQVSGNAQSIMLILADHANDHGICWPTQALIAWKAGCTDRTVRNVLDDMKAQGVIEVMQSGQGRREGEYKGSLIRLHLDRLDDKPPRIRPEEISGLDLEDWKLEAARPEIYNARPETAISDKPSVEPSKESPNGVPPDFEEFWRAYPNKKSGRPKVIATWKKMSAFDRMAAIDSLPIFKASWDWKKESGKYIPMATTFLNNKRYEYPPGNQSQQITPLGQETEAQRRGREPWYQPLPHTGQIVDINSLPHNNVNRAVLSGRPIIG